DAGTARAAVPGLRVDRGGGTAGRAADTAGLWHHTGFDRGGRRLCLQAGTDLRTRRFPLPAGRAAVAPGFGTDRIARPSSAEKRPDMLALRRLGAAAWLPRAPAPARPLRFEP